MSQKRVLVVKKTATTSINSEQPALSKSKKVIVVDRKNSIAASQATSRVKLDTLNATALPSDLSSKPSAEVMRTVDIDDKALNESMANVQVHDDVRDEADAINDLQIFERFDLTRQERCLQAHEKQVKQWQKIDTAVAKKSKNQLISNSLDTYRSSVETRGLIERAIPIEEGSSAYLRDVSLFVVGLGFWKRKEAVGNVLSGLQMHQATIHTEPYACSMVVVMYRIERIGRPRQIRADNDDVQPIKKSVAESEYALQRKKKLKNIINKLTPYEPEFDELAVVGANVWTETGVNNDGGDEIYEEDESLGDESIPDGGSDDGGDVGGGIDVTPTRLCMHLDMGTCMSSSQTLTVNNNTSESLYFFWSKVDHSNPLNVHRTVKSLFYCSSLRGCIPPRSSRDFKFVFSAERPGVYDEVWSLQSLPTQPEGDLYIELRGMATKATTAEDVSIVRDRIALRSVELDARQMVYDMISRAVDVSNAGQRMMKVDRDVHERNLKKMFEKIMKNTGIPWSLSVAEQLQSLIDDLGGTYHTLESLHSGVLNAPLEQRERLLKRYNDTVRANSGVSTVKAHGDHTLDTIVHDAVLQMVNDIADICESLKTKHGILDVTPPPAEVVVKPLKKDTVNKSQKESGSVKKAPNRDKDTSKDKEQSPAPAPTPVVTTATTVHNVDPSVKQAYDTDVINECKKAVSRSLLRAAFLGDVKTVVHSSSSTVRRPVRETSPMAAKINKPGAGLVRGKNKHRPAIMEDELLS